MVRPWAWQLELIARYKVRANLSIAVVVKTEALVNGAES
jgi:hypothetical protein